MDSPLGLTLVAEGTFSTDRGVDIIAIHGLEGYDSWKYSANGHEDGREATFWLRDFLPTDLPSARIFTYGYRSSALCDGQGITKAADKLLDKLKNLQADNVEGSRPLTFVCHSLGGLVLKCALSTAFHNKGDEALNEIITATQGIIFLGTPHSTSSSDLLTSVSRIVAASKATEVDMVAIQSMKQTLIRFTGLTQHSLPWRIVYCYEELPLPGTDFRAVDPSQGESWALPPVSLYSHHLDLCRFTAKHDLSYIKVLQSLRNITSGFSSSGIDEVMIHPTLSSVEDEVLESLETEDVSGNLRDAFQGTCDWILEHAAYKSWLEAPSQLLWITGNPGSGKSTIMKHIVQRYRLERSSSRVVASFFFSHRGTNQSVTSLLSSLLYQLLKSTPSPRTFEIFSRFIERKEHLGSNIAWDSDILAENLLRLVDKSTAHGDSLFFFIDGLDECDEPERIVSLFGRLNTLSPGRKIRVCVSSRPDASFTPVTEIRIEDNNSLDIQRYLCDRLLTLENHLPSTMDVERITQTLTDRSQGVFLWVYLTVSHLRCDSHLKAPMNKQNPTCWLPMGLEAAYEMILKRLWASHDASSRKVAQDAFILVLCAQRPLSIFELRNALAATNCDLDLLAPTGNLKENQRCALSQLHEKQGGVALDMADQLMILCGGLLEVSPRQSESAHDTTCASEVTVHFIHRTARDFLLEKGSWVLERDTCRSLSGESQDSQELHLSQQHRSQDRNARYHLRVAWTCLVFVNGTRTRVPLAQTNDSTSSVPFLGYSLSFGMLHLRLAGQMGVTPMAEDMWQWPPFQKGFIEKWASMHNQLFEDQKLFEPHQTKAVHIMSYYGLPWYDTGLWGARLADINQEDHRGRAPLSLAAAMGHRDICQTLIQEGADMSHRDHVYGQTALSYAAAHGHRDVVELLLRKGSDYDDHSSGVTPLWLASRSGHQDVVELLLQTGADAKATSIHTGETCLSRAAALGNVNITSLLLQRGAEVDTRDKNGWTPLHHAVSQGRKKTIEVLLGVLKSHQLHKLRVSLSKEKTKGSWITTVLRAIIVWVCYQRGGGGGESQTPPAGSKKAKEPSSTAHDGTPTKRGSKGIKHTRGSETDEDDWEEDDKGIHGKRPRRSKPSGRRFACPYHRRNEARFCSGACNGKGFEDISRLKTHLKQFHDRSRGWRRCHICQTRFPRDELKGHKPCKEQDKPTDYEDGFDIDQAEELTSNQMRPSKSSEENCWKAIFRVLFPDWPKGTDVPSPYQETQVQVVPTHCVRAVQQHRTIMTRPNTIAELRASQSDHEFLQILERHLGRFESDFGFPSVSPPRPPPNVSSLSVPSQLTFDAPNTKQDGIQVETRPPGNFPGAQRYQAPPEQFFSQQHSSLPYALRPNFHNPAVSSSDAISSHLYSDLSDMVTENTAFSDPNSIGLGSFDPLSSTDSSGDLARPQFHDQMIPLISQQATHSQPTGNIGVDPGIPFAEDNQDCTWGYPWADLPHSSQQQPQTTLEGFGQNNPLAGGGEEQNPESALLEVRRYDYGSAS